MTPQSDTSTSLFPVGSSNLITGGSFVQYNNVTKPEALKPLYDNVSPNAILNKGGRADSVRCYPGTREEVIRSIEKWHRTNHLQGHPIFWLSGPAGAGKSAIVQTIAERCIERDIPMVNFFFFRADATRNHSDPIVATLLFQLFELVPELKARVMDIAVNNPVIFRQSMEDQFSILIEKPLRAIQETSRQGPLVMLIDGLDECGSQDGKEEQTALLRMLHIIATKANPTFIVLVASRNEGHLIMTFNEIGTSPDSIYLDESYRPFDDIRLFLSGEFSRIKSTHGLRDTLDADWPLPADFNSILNKSSGQFVYAATVMRFISTSPASPQRNLEIVLGLRPVTKTSPFATLDSLYAHILSQADDWKSVHDILAAHQVGSISVTYLTSVLSPFGYRSVDIHSALSDLTSIVQSKSGHNDLTIFHASLLDFLYDSSRSGTLFVDVNAFACRLVPLSFKEANGIRGLKNRFDYLECVTNPDKMLDKFLMSYIPHFDILPMGDIRPKNECMKALENLYQTRDPQLYEDIRNHWQKLFFTAEYASKNNHAKERYTPEENTPTQVVQHPSDNHVMERHTPEETPTQLVPRPSTPPSRCFPKFRWRKNRKT